MSEKESIIANLRSVKTLPDLDAMRLDVVKAMQADGGINFQKIQKEFIKAKNRLRRIPLRAR